MLRPIAKKSGCRVRIKDKKGFPFIFNKYRRRKAFVLGAVVFITLFFFLTSFIWKVEITGNDKIDSVMIIDMLSSLGVRTGVLKYSIDTDKVVNSMMLRIEKLGWIGISIKGTKVRVEINERDLPPKLVPKNVPCDVVAKRDGLIHSIMVLDGIEKVERGETVVKGQLLISGSIDNRNPKEAPRKVHAMGNVKARTWYERSSEVITRTSEKRRTGKVENCYSLVILGKKIGPIPWSTSLRSYEKVEIRKEVSLGEDLVLPFELLTERLYEYEIAEKVIPIDEAREIAYETAYKEVQDALPEGTDITDTAVLYKETGNSGVTAIVTIECLEEIGVEKEIGGE